MKYILSVITVILILFLFLSKENNIQALKKTDTILAFGDSLTYGFNAKENESYPSILSKLSGHKVINAGINGDTSANGLRRLPKFLEDDTIKLMILFFGGNDVMQRLPTEELKSNLKTMIHLAKEKNIDILLISVPNMSLFGLSPLDIYKEISDEEDVPLLSGMLANILSQASLKSDQIHPNALGYKLMAEKIYKSLKENGWIK